jgi:hypothetical protein
VLFGFGWPTELRIGSVPSIVQVMMPRAVEKIRKRDPRGERETVFFDV